MKMPEVPRQPKEVVSAGKNFLDDDSQKIKLACEGQA